MSTRSRPAAAMLQARARLRFSSLGLAAARLLAAGPVRNPVLYLDVQADGEPLGRIIIEVSSELTQLATRGVYYEAC